MHDIRPLAVVDGAGLIALFFSPTIHFTKSLDLNRPNLNAKL
jgi:hypothetical protein